MLQLNFIKNLHFNINFGRDKKIEIASGKQSEGVFVLSSPLETKAVDLSKNSIYKQTKRLKSRRVD